MKNPWGSAELLQTSDQMAALDAAKAPTVDFKTIKPFWLIS